jgi:hypothetical protein
MPHDLMPDTDALTREELKEILTTEGPCVTVLIPFEEAQRPRKQEHVRLKHGVAEAERRLTVAGVSQEEIRNLLQPLRDFAADWEPDDARGGGIAILRSRDLFRVIRLSSPLQESVAVGSHFEIRPFLREFEAHRPFCILALAQKNVRMLRCTDHSSEEVPLPRDVAKDLDSWGQFSQPDHNLLNKSTAGPSAGTSKGILQSTNTDRDDKDEYLLHFYKQIDRGVNEVLRREQAIPVVPAGVDYELALYHRVSTYPYLLRDGVHGAPDGLKGGEMHKRALELVRSQLDPGLERALSLYDDNISLGRAAHQVNQVVRCAFEGRVCHLLLADGASQMGNFDDATQRVKQHGSFVPGDEDLLNAAALQTILHGGEVYLVPKEIVPGNSVIAAVLRY